MDSFLVLRGSVSAKLKTGYPNTSLPPATSPQKIALSFFHGPAYVTPHDTLPTEGARVHGGGAATPGHDARAKARRRKSTQ